MTTVHYARGSAYTPPGGIEDLLLAVLSAPPHEFDEERVGRLVSLWDEYVQVPGFRTVTARLAEDGRLVGVAWGWDTVIGTKHEPQMYGNLYRVIDDQPWAAALRGTEIAELAVHPDLQGRGIGSRVRELLLDGGPGWLLARPGSAALQVYRQAGWQELGEFGDEVRLVAFASP